MTEQQHPITPPPELMLQWLGEYFGCTLSGGELSGSEEFLAARAAQWGADQELEACCEWLKSEGHEYEHEALFAARRPKPPSLKEQALIVLDDAGLDAAHENILRRALEALPDD